MTYAAVGAVSVASVTYCAIAALLCQWISAPPTSSSFQCSRQTNQYPSCHCSAQSYHELDMKGDSLMQLGKASRSKRLLMEAEDPDSTEGGSETTTGPGAFDPAADTPSLGGNGSAGWSANGSAGGLSENQTVPGALPERVVVPAPPFLHIDWLTPTRFNITAVASRVGASRKVVVRGIAKILVGLVAAGMMMALISYLYDNRRNIALARAEIRGASGDSPRLEDDGCQYVMIFPLPGQTKTQFCVSGTRAMYIRWEDTVPALEQARSIFRDPSKAHAVSDEELQERFQENMKQSEYCAAIRALVQDVLAGPEFGMDIEAFSSPNNDEFYLKLKLPADTEIVEAFAAQFRYNLPLSDKVYDFLDASVQKNSFGDEVRAYSPYICNDVDLFQPFRPVDHIRLIAARLNRYIDITELMKQQVLAEHFVVHDFKVVNEFVETWATPRLWYRFLPRSAEDKIRNYFGEEVAWLFVWQSFFVHQLLVPTAIGAFLFFRRWVLSIESQRKVQIMFGLFMSVWVTIFNRRYARHEAGLRQRWGMNKLLVSSMYIRDEYVPDNLTTSWKVSAVMLLGDGLAITMVILCMLGVRWVHSLREHMMELNSPWVWQQAAAVLISCQILALDMIWRRISQWLVDGENHRTPFQWNRAWVHKVFLVRFFNNLYPFLYIGFVKQFSYQGCPDTRAGCLDELQRYLVTYFVTRLIVHLSTDMFLVVLARSQLGTLRANDAGTRLSMHLQVQAKSQEYDAVMKVDDWTENVLTFLFLTCFNVVLPVIALLTMLTTMLETRCMGHRNCCFLRRPVPRGSEGIGEWQQLLETVEFLAVLINVGFAVFTMRPMKDLPSIHKVVIFAFIEHLILFLKHLIKEKFPTTSNDVEDMAQTNEELLRQAASFIEEHRRADVATPLSKRISSRMTVGMPSMPSHRASSLA